MSEQEPIVVSFRDVSKAFGNKVVLAGINLDVRRGEMLVVMGQEGGARPDHVLAALGFMTPYDSIHRAGLTLVS